MFQAMQRPGTFEELKLIPHGQEDRQKGIVEWDELERRAYQRVGILY